MADQSKSPESNITVVTPTQPSGSPTQQTMVPPLDLSAAALPTTHSAPPVVTPVAMEQPSASFIASLVPHLAHALNPYLTSIVQSAVKPLHDHIMQQDKVIMEQKKRIDEQEVTIHDLQRANDDLSSRVEEAECQVEELEQYGRRNSLRFHNITIPSLGCDTDKVIVDLCKDKLGVSITEDDISRSHPIGQPNRQGKVQLIARFRNWKIKNNIYVSKKKLRGSDDKIFITEDLTSYRQSIIRYISAAKRDRKIASYWTNDGRIFVKLSERGSKILIRSVEDLHATLSSQQ
ncbi:hypothetical protein FSP39_017270 [Pinctada imbricata]|uniref:Uncharacterized protein n=1 Tax=Pinctada imbricata TaxID=66713 RepID=A0AA88XMS7_PINIB|nr:hypothetical protein FSP39_017270 [Pinctada imbricata]